MKKLLLKTIVLMMWMYLRIPGCPILPGQGTGLRINECLSPELQISQAYMHGAVAKMHRDAEINMLLRDLYSSIWKHGMAPQHMRRALEELMMEDVKKILAQRGGTIRRAAKQYGINPKTLSSMLERHGIHAADLPRETPEERSREMEALRQTFSLAMHRHDLSFPAVSRAVERLLMEDINETLASLAGNVSKAAQKYGLSLPTLTSMLKRHTIDPAAYRKKLKPREVQEKQAIISAFQRLGNNKTEVAGALGMSRKGLRAKIERYGIDIDALAKDFAAIRSIARTLGMDVAGLYELTGRYPFALEALHGQQKQNIIAALHECCLNMRHAAAALELSERELRAAIDYYDINIASMQKDIEGEEKRQIEDALWGSGGGVVTASNQLAMDHRTLQEKIKKYRINVQHIKNSVQKRRETCEKAFITGLVYMRFRFRRFEDPAHEIAGFLGISRKAINKKIKQYIDPKLKIPVQFVSARQALRKVPAEHSSHFLRSKIAEALREKLIADIERCLMFDPLPGHIFLLNSHIAGVFGIEIFPLLFGKTFEQLEEEMRADTAGDNSCFQKNGAKLLPDEAPQKKESEKSYAEKLQDVFAGLVLEKQQLAAMTAEAVSLFEEAI